MRLKNLDLIAALLFVVLNIIWVQLPVRPWIIGLLLVLPLTLFLPGYTLTQTLFRKRPAGEKSPQTSARPTSPEQAPKAAPLKLGHPIGKADQVILSLGLSMAIDILVGFVLNILSIKLEALSWTFALGLLIALCASLALFMRRHSHAAETTPIMRATQLRLTWLDAAFLLLALCITLNAVWLAVNRPPVPQPSFTQFWMLPANPADKSCAVSLGVQSFETTALTYSVSMTVNNVVITPGWPKIVLTPQQKWVQQVPITPEAHNDLHVEARLFKIGQPFTVYRDVHLTFHVATVLQNGQAQLQCTL